MEIGNVAGDQLTLGVVPGSRPDAAARVHGGCIALGLLTQIGVPSLVTRAGCGGEVLANLVGACEATEISGARNCAGDEEAHWLLRSWGCQDDCRTSKSEPNSGKNYRSVHDRAPGLIIIIWPSISHLSQPDKPPRSLAFPYTIGIRPDFQNPSRPSFRKVRFDQTRKPAEVGGWIHSGMESWRVSSELSLNHGACEPQKMARSGAVPGSASSDPAGITTPTPSRVTCGTL